MRVFAYCTERAARTVAAAVGVEPLTSPPMVAARFSPVWLEGCEVLYFRLHNVPGRRGWWGEGLDRSRPLALVEPIVEAAELGGAVAVVANCRGADGDPMVGALYRAGASVVIAGPGVNVAAGNRVVGTDLLMKWLIRGLRIGMGVRRALVVARARLGLTAWRAADRDAMAFRVMRRRDDGYEAEAV